MRKFLIVEAVVASLAIVAILGYALNNNETEGTFAAAFGLRTPGTNEYGCSANCTAEYEIGHVYQLFENKPNGYSIDGVRFKVRFSCDSAGNRWFQDLWDSGSYELQSQIRTNLDHLLMLNGREQGLTNFKKGDLVSFYATVSKVWSPVGGENKVLYAENPVFYRVNDKEDLSLLESPVYIPE